MCTLQESLTAKLIYFGNSDWPERYRRYSPVLVEDLDRSRAGIAGLHRFHRDAEVDRRTYSLAFHYRGGGRSIFW